MKSLPLILSPLLLIGADIEALQYQSLRVTHLDGRSYVVERYVPAECLDVGITPEQIWKKENVPSACIQPLVSTVGKLSKVSMDEDIETYGELEVLAYMKAMPKMRGSMLLVDSRSEEWYEHETIPGAVNIWFMALTRPELFPEEFKRALEQLQITINKDGSFDFSNAPFVLLFCNGAWCTQSPNAIKALMKMGYPKEKLKWYRGGMHDWKGLSMTTTLRQPDAR